MRIIWRFFLATGKRLSDYLVARGLSFRLAWKRRIGTKGEVFRGFSTSDLPVVVINLKRREDRREEVVANLVDAGFSNILVLEAIDGRQKYPGLLSGNAANLGCTESHMMAIERYLSSVGPIAVCEDDNQFSAEPAEIHQYISSFLDTSLADVLCLVARNRGPRVELNAELDAVGWAMAPSFYIVKPTARPNLLRSYQRSAKKLLAQRRRGPFDQVWRWTQRLELIFAMPRQKLGRQKESFSDIQGKYFHGT